MSIEAMKQALEALETNNKAWKSLADSGDAGWWEAEEQPFYEVSVKAITALRQAIEQAQEPVAWMFQHEETGRMNYVSNDGMNTPELFLKMNRRYVFVCALYTTPPQRQWVGLTDEERKNIMVECESTGDWAWELKAAQAIETKLKQKNTWQDGNCKHCTDGCPACDARRQSNVLP